MCAVLAFADQAAQPPLDWDLLFAGSWEESKTLSNRSDIRLGITQPGLLVRGQATDRRTLNFKLEKPWGDAPNRYPDASFGLYHKATGSRLLYGHLDEWGLPARIRSPWIRSAPFAENHKPVMADLKTAVSSTKAPEAYLYLSSPRIAPFGGLPDLSVRGFASAQIAADNIAGRIDAESEGDLAPAFSGGVETFLGTKAALLLEGFYTGTELAAKPGSTWFSDPPPLPARDFRLGAAAMMLNMPYVSLSSDWAWSQTFAYGSGVYGNLGIRVNPPISFNAKPGPWSLSLAADGMGERYTGRDGSSPPAGFRTAGKLERKGQRGSLFRASTSLRGPGFTEDFDRSSAGVYYGFPSSSGAGSPLRISRVSLNAGRNASDLKKISDSVDGTLGLSLKLPPLLLPSPLLPASYRRAKNPKPKSYPLGITLSTDVSGLGSSGEVPPPVPFSPLQREFDSSKTSCELLWSPGILQFRTKWGYTAYAKKDDQWDASFSAAVRFKHGRFSVKCASPVFPDIWNCTLAWRLEL